jgi:mitogen-activated protein kinase kinase
MLLQHAWLAVLDKPATIEEEDEEAAEEAAANGEPLAQVASPQSVPTKVDDGGFIDREVGEWVIGAIERRRNGTMGKSAKPALHAAPLDAAGVASPKAVA